MWNVPFQFDILALQAGATLHQQLRRVSLVGSLELESWHDKRTARRTPCGSKDAMTVQPEASESVSRELIGLLEGKWIVRTPVIQTNPRSGLRTYLHDVHDGLQQPHWIAKDEMVHVEG